jgi:hypothetical protein
MIHMLQEQAQRMQKSRFATARQAEDLDKDGRSLLAASDIGQRKYIQTVRAGDILSHF